MAKNSGKLTACSERNQETIHKAGVGLSPSSIASILIHRSRFGYAPDLDLLSVH